MGGDGYFGCTSRRLLKAHGLKLATAESCTGGGVAHAITDVAGSSACLSALYRLFQRFQARDAGRVAGYLMHHGAVSEATVREMVAGALQHSSAQVALAVSGIAGPEGGTADKRSHGMVRVGHQTWCDACATAPD